MEEFNGNKRINQIFHTSFVLEKGLLRLTSGTTSAFVCFSGTGDIAWHELFLAGQTPRIHEQRNEYEIARTMVITFSHKNGK